MSAIFQGTTEQAVDLITQGVKVQFQSLVRKKLTEVAAEIVEQAAVEAAGNVTAKVLAYRHTLENKTVVEVRFNEKVLP